MARTIRCKLCGLDIMFLHTRDGKRLPVDPYPHEGGNVVARPHAGGLYVDAHVLRDAAVPDGYRLFMPHFATCQARARRRAVPEPASPDLFSGGVS